MSAEFGAPVDVFINPTSDPDGETIVTIPLGAVFKFLRDTGEWSKEDFVGPVLASKPKDANNYLAIQLFNRRSIDNIKIKFYKNSGYHRKDNIIMMKASDGMVYGLASNNDYLEQLNMLEKKLKEFVETPLSPMYSSSRTSSPLLSTTTDSLANQSFEISTPVNNDNIFKPMPFKPYHPSVSPFRQEIEKEVKWQTKPCMIPASVYRRAAAPKNASRASSVTPISMNNTDKLFSYLNAEKPVDCQVPSTQNDTRINGSLFHESPQNNFLSQKSKLLSCATASNTLPRDRMDAVMELINFAYTEGLHRGQRNSQQSLLEMSNVQLLNVLEEVLTRKPDVKAILLEKFN